MVQAEDCWHKSLDPLIAEVREKMDGSPVYISFDIDTLNPTFVPGTDTMEPRGLTSNYGFEIIRGCHGMNIIGGDLVDIAPLYDNSRITAMLGTNPLYERLCALSGANVNK